MKFEYRWPQVIMAVITTLWFIALCGTMYKIVEAQTEGGTFVACLMFIAVLGAGMCIVAWYENRPK